LIRQWNYQENEIGSYSLNTSGIKAGIYVLRVDRNNRSTDIKVVIQ